jgi:hypothetical protein
MNYKDWKETMLSEDGEFVYLSDEIKKEQYNSYLIREKEDKPMFELWKDVYIGKYTFYCGFFTKGDFRLGISIGNECSSVDLLIFTFGFMK